MSHNRRIFIKFFYAGLLAALVLIWDKLAKNHKASHEAQKRVLPLHANQSVAFQDNYIVLNEKGKIRVFSSHCTHLGCKIQEFRRGKLICPCHGSEYNLNGIPTKGPAFKSLTEYKTRISHDKSSIEIVS